jgi:hypothetical protein
MKDGGSARKRCCGIGGAKRSGELKVFFERRRVVNVKITRIRVKR